MWQPIFLILPVLATTLAIKVPVDDAKVEAAPDASSQSSLSQPSEGTQVPVYYTSDQANVDSYLIPPDPYQTQQEVSGEAPATFLLPPSEQPQDGYIFSPTQGAQSDWYPMGQVLQEFQPSSLLPPNNDGELIPMLPYNPPHPPHPSRHIQLPLKTRGGKGFQRSQVPVPSTKLEPPLESAQNHFLINVPSEELELPKEESSQQLNDDDVREQDLRVQRNKNFKPSSDVVRDEPKPLKLNPTKPTLSLSLLPPKPDIVISRLPTKLYPKKYAKGFKPIPIPIRQFADESLKPNGPSSSSKEYLTPSDEKKLYLYEQTEKKKQHREQATQDDEGDLEDIPITAQEQETSETFRQPGRNAYPAPVRQSSPPAPVSKVSSVPPPDGDRTEFRMHGMKGPHSYQFGYDTGKGKNRQFRFEERDNAGRVHGHYGYVDRNGKLRVVNYDADPKLGFRAEAEPDKAEPDNEPDQP